MCWGEGDVEEDGGIEVGEEGDEGGGWVVDYVEEGWGEGEEGDG